MEENRAKAGGPTTRWRAAQVLALGYVHLWASEGAIRKWIAPQLSNYVYLLRDVVFAMAILGVVLFPQLARARRRPAHTPELIVLIYAGFIVLLGAIHLLIQDTDPFVVVLGIKNYLAPVLFVIFASVALKPDDYRSICVAVQLWVVPNLVLAMLQAASPTSSFVNRVGLDQYQNLTTSDGVARASGTFTSPAGLAAFVLLALALTMFHSRACRISWNNDLLGADRSSLSSGGTFQVTVFAFLIMTAAVAGSRGLLTSVAVVLVLYGLFTWKPTIGRPIAVITLLACSAFIFLVFTPVVDAFVNRVDNASRSESAGDRVSSVTLSVLGVGDVTIVGEGPGSHTAAARRYNPSTNWIENDSLRTNVELGSFGLIVNFIRRALPIAVLAYGFANRKRLDQRYFGLAIFVSLTALTGTMFGQPTSEGAVAIALGIVYLIYLKESEIAFEDRRIRYERRALPTRS